MTDSQFATLADPFAMLVHPEAVLQAVSQSGRLGSLASRICRPLDKPLIPKREGDGQQAFDDQIERTEVPDAGITLY
ncbi:MAG: hypothetical protein U1E89_20785 [Burkholderiaceae bacterium]